MTSQEWATGTNMFTFFGRSGALKAVDIALRNFHQSRTGDRARVLKSALTAWVDSKPNGWTGAGGRNARGTVAELRQQIDHYLAPIVPALAIPLPPPVPIAVPLPPPLSVVSALPVPAAQMYVPGALIQDKLGGNHFEISLQQKGSSCGPACLRILIKQVKNERVGEEALRAIIDGSLGGGGVVVSNNSHDWVNQGTWGMDKALESYRINATLHRTNPNQFLLAATLKKPCIAVVEWTGAGGLHYVVVVGKNSVGTITVLDPWYGLQQFSTSNVSGVETVNNYEPNDNGSTFPSTWYQWVLAVN